MTAIYTVLFVLSFTIITVTCKVSYKEAKTAEKVVLIAPVLAAPNDYRTIVTEVAKDFPTLMVIATDEKKNNNMSNKKEEVSADETQPIYVKKLINSNLYRRHRRRILTSMLENRP